MTLPSGIGQAQYVLLLDSNSRCDSPGAFGGAWRKPPQVPNSKAFVISARLGRTVLCWWHFQHCESIHTRKRETFSAENQNSYSGFRVVPLLLVSAKNYLGYLENAMLKRVILTLLCGIFCVDSRYGWYCVCLQIILFMVSGAAYCWSSIVHWDSDASIWWNTEIYVWHSNDGNSHSKPVHTVQTVELLKYWSWQHCMG